ncbi:hypothetical protein IWQ47_001954 [Aquimarina sp. EL_43]|uniref:hypothetical protein n=1 Tax=unclassified Aquimarina TaxID=2627091 RepID=UPI0018C8FA5F|nr:MULTISPECIES: hypothetical protein [unclassified Aquimarina]MBG6129963.1 hypothetical protein [Aquimarina sp. EL_35]MBG6148743.1 hypothetical protein [Aquimarina sp. EL_32]MBG6168883.1 hypothetical protein [Aquimarina sp. EL_43]
MENNHANEIHEQLKNELLESLSLFGNSEYTGYDPLRPVSKIIFSAQGEITSPPDLEFMGYGGGSEGESFSACGGINLESFFPLDDKGEYFASDDEEYIEKCIEKAGSAVLAALTSISNSDEFQKLPKDGPVVFVINLIDQLSKVICRIHPNGEVELPPKKK